MKFLKRVLVASIIVIIIASGFTIYDSFFKYVNFENNPSLENEPEIIINDATKSVLMIEHKLSNGNSSITKTASAVIIASDEFNYYAITNYHVMSKEDYTTDSITLYDYLNSDYIGVNLISNETLELISSSYDLALVLFEKSTIELPVAIPFDKTLNSSMLLTSVGYPETIRTTSNGFYVGFRNINNVVIPVIEHTSYLEHGFSGGGLFANSGRLVGINTAGVFDNNNNFITGYAIPVNYVFEYLNLFIK